MFHLHLSLHEGIDGLSFQLFPVEDTILSLRITLRRIDCPESREIEEGDIRISTDRERSSIDSYDLRRADRHELDTTRERYHSRIDEIGIHHRETRLDSRRAK